MKHSWIAVLGATLLLAPVCLCQVGRATQFPTHTHVVATGRPNRVQPNHKPTPGSAVQLVTNQLSNRCVHRHCTPPRCQLLSADGLIPYFDMYYCNLSNSSSAVKGLVQFCLILLLILLFRVLGSTAVWRPAGCEAKNTRFPQLQQEDFFSPTLSQISQELGVPPRLAGGMQITHFCTDTC